METIEIPAVGADAPRYPLARPLVHPDHLTLTLADVVVCALSLVGHIQQHPSGQQTLIDWFLQAELERKDEEVAALKAGLSDMERVLHRPPAQREKADRLLGPMRVSRMTP